MKLALVANPLAPSADDAFCREISYRAPTRGHQISVITSTAQIPKTDALIVNGPQIESLSAALRADLPTLLRLVDPLASEPAAAAAELKRLALACRHVLVPSAFMKCLVEAWGMPANRVAIVPYAYDHVFAQQITLVTMRASRPSTFGMVTSGIINSENLAGFETVLSAVSRLRLECQLSVIGTGPALEALKARAQSLLLGPRVNFLGDLYPAKKMEHLRAAKAYIEPSLHQGFPSFVLDAMSEGCPVVGVGAGPVPELVRDGENGLLYRNGDASSLSEQLTNLASTPGLSLELIAGGVRTVEERTWDKTAACVFDIVENLEVTA